MKSTIKVLLFMLMVVLLSQCEKDKESKTFKDARDGQIYKWVKIGDQIWMAENLNFYTDDSHYYNNDSITHVKNGRLYKYDEACNTCPDGWHLPSDEEWMELEFFLGMKLTELYIIGNRGWSEDIGTKLKIGGSTGFNALCAGVRDRWESGDYTGFGEWGFFRTSSQSDIWPENAYYREVYADSACVRRSESHKTYGMSVRCIKDN